MGYGTTEKNKKNIKKSNANNEQNKAQKNIFNFLRQNGIPNSSNSVTLGAESLLQEKSITMAADKPKDFSLIKEQTKENKIDNPNIQTSKKKRGKSLSSDSFPSNDDPFFETGLAKPEIESIKKANEQREILYKKSLSVANYLALSNNLSGR